MSEGEDDAQKTEDATPKKIEESRKKGQVALSREVNNFLMLLAGTMLIAVMAGPVFSDLGILMRALWAPEAIKPSLSKISLIKGFGRIFSMRSLMEFVKGMIKIGLVAVVGTIILYPFYDKMEHLIDIPMVSVLAEMQILVVRLMIGVLIVVFVIAAIDLVYQRYEHHKKMKMSKQEIKDEYKQSEGDPHVKARLRQLRAERARQRMVQAVPEADVVITNPSLVRLLHHRALWHATHHEH